MLNTNRTRSVVTLALMAGLLGVAGPASAQVGDVTRSAPATVTMIDYMGSPVVSKTGAIVVADFNY